MHRLSPHIFASLPMILRISPEEVLALGLCLTMLRVRLQLAFSALRTTPSMPTLHL